MSLRFPLALSGWVALAATVLPAGAAARVLITTLFLLACPGLAAMRWIRPNRPPLDPVRVAALEAGVLAVLLSLALSALVAEALFLSHAFSADRALLVLASLTSVLALVPRPGGTGRALPWYRDDPLPKADTPR